MPLEFLFLKIKDSIALSDKTSKTDERQELDLLMDIKYFERTRDYAMNMTAENFTQILHRSSFRFYIDQIPFDYKKIL